MKGMEFITSSREITMSTTKIIREFAGRTGYIDSYKERENSQTMATQCEIVVPLPLPNPFSSR